MATAIKTNERLFWAKVDQSAGAAGCWPWLGVINGDGYGEYGRKPPRRAHRRAYEAVLGPIPEGMCLDHRCHTSSTDCPGGACSHRRCVNPAHLEVVTVVENAQRVSRALFATQRHSTHCRKGHELTAANTYRAARRPTRRECRACRTARFAERYQR